MNNILGSRRLVGWSAKPKASRTDVDGRRKRDPFSDTQMKTHISTVYSHVLNTNTSIDTCKQSHIHDLTADSLFTSHPCLFAGNITFVAKLSRHHKISYITVCFIYVHLIMNINKLGGKKIDLHATVLGKQTNLFQANK